MPWTALPALADIVDAVDAPAFEPGAGEIRFEHVAFRYKMQDEALYRDFFARGASGRDRSVGRTNGLWQVYVRQTGAAAL